MILAAGLGTRLRPLTNDRPKALVEIAGRTLLEITLRRLQAFGIRDVIVNVHHFADSIVAYIEKNGSFGMRVEISRENVLLDTGGGLKKAAWFFQEEPSGPFLLHNVDVLSTIDFDAMLHFHHAHSALVTLAVQKRETSRQLLFDRDHLLCGRRTGRDGKPEMFRPVDCVETRAFSGVHIISPDLLPRICEEGVFSIIGPYLRLAGEGARISEFSADQYYWRDLGKPENVEQAERDVRNGLIQL